MDRLSELSHQFFVIVQGVSISPPQIGCSLIYLTPFSVKDYCFPNRLRLFGLIFHGIFQMEYQKADTLQSAPNNRIPG